MADADSSGKKESTLTHRSGKRKAEGDIQPSGGGHAPEDEGAGGTRVSRGLIPNDESDFFETYKPKLSKPNLFGLFTANMTVESLTVTGGAPVEAIRLPGQYSTEDSRSRTLYARAFYPDLIRECFSNKCCVLVGNPGTSKSTLQYILLAAMLAPKEMPFPADGALSAARTALERFKVVVRQVGPRKAEIFFIEKRVHMFTGSLDGELFGHFDPDTTLYLYEPEEKDPTQPFRFIDRVCKVGQSLSTLSPWEARYTGYLKQVDDPSLLYMPLYTEEELVTIGADMARQPGFGLDPRLYAEGTIRRRFSQFGGVIRNVLVSKESRIAVAQKGKDRAIDDMTPQLALRLITNFEASDQTAGSNSVSHQLVLLDARRAPKGDGYDFRNCTSVLADLAVEKTLSAKLLELTIAEKAQFLQRAERGRDAALLKVARTVYEEVLYHRLTRQGVQWHARPLGSDGNAAESWKKISIACFTSRKRRIVPYGELKEGMLAYPPIENFPFCDFYFRDFQDKANKATLVCVQVWFGLSTATREMSPNALAAFKEMVKPSPGALIKLVLVPAHSMSDSATLARPIKKQPVAGKAGAKASVKSALEWRELGVEVEVWRPPANYGHKA